MPQLDQFTYLSQFFWLCLLFFTFYIFICNDGDGVLGISRILKLRNQLLSHRGKNIRSKDHNRFEDILRKGFSTGLDYMYSTLFEVDKWCKAGDLLGKMSQRTLISSFGEISGSRGMERNIFYFISKSSYSTSSNPGWGITCMNARMKIFLVVWWEDHTVGKDMVIPWPVSWRSYEQVKLDRRRLRRRARYKLNTRESREALLRRLDSLVSPPPAPLSSLLAAILRR